MNAFTSRIEMDFWTQTRSSSHSSKVRENYLNIVKILLISCNSGGFNVSLLSVQALFRKHAKGKPEICFSTFLGLVADIALVQIFLPFGM